MTPFHYSVVYIVNLSLCLIPV